ncbi:para-nitrobenzyl esterase [Neolewinella xylanilytica]|uniref:Carboxylic ester hydrolase n=1 Tax=Neolewinella xylanilytica TaxID=1514080 RepID=A0A2S6I4Q8_9BACT|nr:carboxylesterase family protein [Neolewinella xylanilytica]PPK86144.1 para-nitrobenzyl esterase [Neolewinella xylanilytica]
MKFTYLLLLLSLMTHASVTAQHNYGIPVRATTAAGTVEGLYDTRNGVQTYLGIPFAAPPVGDLRWRAPRPVEAWEGVRETKAFGARAVQPPVFGDMDFRSSGMSEDCLYLNVWSPAASDTAALPVMVYFYGGGFVAGDGSEPRYDGSSMAEKGIVAVTVNYRLNIFGFLAHPELSAEADYGASGNYGLLDQQAALQWVHDNIAAFGGDPDRVTIAGESAGSVSVSIQMASPLSRNLIAGAIGESGAGIQPTLAPVPLSEAERTGREFAEAAGYTSLAELRKLSTLEVYRLYTASGRFGFPLVVDGYLLPGTLPEIFAAGEQAQVPLLLGWNSAEIPGMALMQGQAYSEENYSARVRATYPERHAEVLKLYPHGSPEEIEQSATDLASDRFIVYSTWRWFDLHRKNSDAAVYRYLFSRVRPPLVDQSRMSALAGGTVERDESAPPPPQPIGAPHASEIEYCLGNLPLVDDYAWTETDYEVSRVMQEYFANFIKTGDPNAAALPDWPAAAADEQSPPVMVIDAATEMKAAENDARYRFLQQTYPEG